MALSLDYFLNHADSNFRRVADIWQRNRRKGLPCRSDLTLMALLPVSAKIVLLDIDQKVPKVIYCGTDAQTLFYFDPQGVSLMQAFSYDTYQRCLQALDEVKHKKALHGHLLRDGGAVDYELLVLPVRNEGGHVIQALCVGAHQTGQDGTAPFADIVSKNDDIRWTVFDPLG